MILLFAVLDSAQYLYCLELPAPLSIPSGWKCHQFATVLSYQAFFITHIQSRNVDNEYAPKI